MTVLLLLLIIWFISKRNTRNLNPTRLDILKEMTTMPGWRFARFVNYVSFLCLLEEKVNDIFSPSTCTFSASYCVASNIYWVGVRIKIMKFSPMLKRQMCVLRSFWLELRNFWKTLCHFKWEIHFSTNSKIRKYENFFRLFYFIQLFFI